MRWNQYKGIIVTRDNKMCANVLSTMQRKAFILIARLTLTLTDGNNRSGLCIRVRTCAYNKSESIIHVSIY